ncbi:MAG: dCTP deaminase [Stenomitos frigidus ULC029]
MILNDRRIRQLCGYDGMVSPFEPELVRAVEGRKVISYGLSSFGYDIRLAASEFRIFQRKPGEIVDPKRFDSANLIHSELQQCDGDQFFILPANSYALGVSVERFNLPRSLIGVCIGKSTYARSGVIVNVTPMEPGWKGYLTIEVSNASSADCRIYANEGIAQMLFLEGEPCEVSYADRSGKYQDQNQNVELARV